MEDINSLKQWSYVYLAAGFVSVVFSLDFAHSVAKFLSYFFGILIFHWVMRKFQTTAQLRKILSFFIIMAVLYSLYGICQYLLFDKLRVTALMTHPNALAKFLLLVIPVAISYLDDARSVRTHVMFGLAALIPILTLMLTFARGAWIGLMGSYLLLLLLKRSKKLFLGLGVLLVVISLSLPQFGWERLYSIPNPNHHWNIERVHGWEASVKIIRDYPLTGVGLANFGMVYPRYKNPEAKEMLGHAHNTYLVIATEMGLPALFAFLMINGIVFRLAISRYASLKSSEPGTLVAGALAGIFGFLLYALVEYNFNNEFNHALYWIFMAVVVSATCFATGKANHGGVT